MKILNLYAGIGGNRKLWGDEHEITAIENNKDIATIYQDFHPRDKVIVTNARKYLLEHYKEFDFIWSSKPCTTHSRIRIMAVRKGDYVAVYPDMGLYEEIIFLEHNFKGKYVIENVIPYYKPLIKPTAILDRHMFWSNFIIPIKKFEGFGKGRIRKGHCKELQEIKGINIDKYKINGRRKDSILRSYVNPDIGLHVFNCAFKIKQQTLRRD